MAGPLLLAFIPPNIRFTLRPRFSFGIGGRAVIEQAPVMRPGPSPFGSDPVLFPIWLSAGSLVDATFKTPRVNPAAATSRTVVLQRRKPIHQLSIGDSVAVDLLQDSFCIGFLKSSFGRIIPCEIQYRPVLRFAGTGI